MTGKTWNKLWDWKNSSYSRALDFPSMRSTSSMMSRNTARQTKMSRESSVWASKCIFWNICFIFVGFILCFILKIPLIRLLNKIDTMMIQELSSFSSCKDECNYRIRNGCTTHQIWLTIKLISLYTFYVILALEQREDWKDPWDKYLKHINKLKG